MNGILQINEVKSKLFTGMLDAFEQNDFSFIKTENGYQRKNGASVQKFYFLFYKKQEDVFIEPRWSIKFPEILEIYHKVATKEKKYFKNTSVLENSLGELINYFENGDNKGTGKTFKYVVESFDDINVLIKVIPKRFNDYVLPYFNFNNTVKRVDELLNTDPEELSIHQWLYPLRACMGIIAAKIAGNPDIKKLAKIYYQEFNEAQPSYKEEFQKLRKLFSI